MKHEHVNREQSECLRELGSKMALFVIDQCDDLDSANKIWPHFNETTKAELRLAIHKYNGGLVN